MTIRSNFRLLLSVAALHGAPVWADVTTAIADGIKSVQEKIEEGRNSADHLKVLEQDVIDRKDKTALKELEQLAGRGYTSPMVFLGCMSEKGIVGEHADAYRAAQYYQAAAKIGEGLAAYDLGLLYLYGRGIPKDESVAINLFQIAGKNGIKHAAVNLGLIFEEKKKWVDALRWWQLASGDRKHDVATFRYGLWMYRGIGITRNMREGLILIRRAAETWNPDALMALVEIYSNGLGVEQNLQEAAKWMEILHHGSRDFDHRAYASLLNPFGMPNVNLEAAQRSAQIWMDAHPVPTEITRYNECIY